MRFALLMSLYGGDDIGHLRETLKNLQKIYFDEIVIVFDGPVPSEFEEIVRQYLDPEVLKFVRMCENLGLGIALARGVEEIESDYFFRMDSDDLFIPEGVEFLKHFVASERPDLVGGQMAEFVNDPLVRSAERIVPKSIDDILRFAKLRNPFNHITICANTRAVMEVGNYPHQLLCHEDYGLWIKMLNAGKTMMNVGEIISVARVGNGFAGRRSGLKYFRHEVKFVVSNISFFKYWSVVYLGVRLPLRLFGAAVPFVYQFLRKKNT